MNSKDNNIYYPANVSEIINGNLYLGNLEAALSTKLIDALGITHIVSVLQGHRSTGSHHLSLFVDDEDYEDLLIHLPKACQFIEDALAGGGKVLVHCVLGISRSATVVAAYLMKTRHWDRRTAIKYIKDRRVQISPNEGFLKQLDTFAECEYAPSPENAVYRSWKLACEEDKARFTRSLIARARDIDIAMANASKKAGAGALDKAEEGPRSSSAVVGKSASAVSASEETAKVDVDVSKEGEAELDRSNVLAFDKVLTALKSTLGFGRTS